MTSASLLHFVVALFWCVLLFLSIAGYGAALLRLFSIRRPSLTLAAISGSNLSLMTGLPSICDDFGTMDLAVRVQAYRPGWYIAWNQVEDDKMDALAPMYHLQRVAAFPALDDPERNLLILYRLDPATPAPPPAPHRKSLIPRLLRASFGRQPSPIQLEH